MGRNIKFIEGENDSRTESFTITDTNRLDIISVNTTPNYITPCTNNTNTNTNTSTTPSNGGVSSSIEIPVPITKGGTAAITANSALFNLGIDVSNKTDGAVLAYKTTSGKFEATNNPYNLQVDGGYF